MPFLISRNSSAQIIPKRIYNIRLLFICPPFSSAGLTRSCFLSARPLSLPLVFVNLFLYRYNPFWKLYQCFEKKFAFSG